uniref:C-type lectin domain-containing protein n=1 Tax=Xenopus tropicalis TaxID=8364 RepID=A0A6I8T071_XENTR
PVTENSPLLAIISDLCVTEGKRRNLVHDRDCELCPLNWMAHKGKCYYFSDNRDSWATSADKCKKMKADIISMEDPEEEVSFTHLFIGKKCTRCSVMVGFAEMSKYIEQQYTTQSYINCSKR